MFGGAAHRPRPHPPGVLPLDVLWAGDGDGLGAGGVVGGASVGVEGAGLVGAPAAAGVGAGAALSVRFARALWRRCRGLGVGVAAGGLSVPAGRTTFWLVAAV